MIEMRLVAGNVTHLVHFSFFSNSQFSVWNPEKMQSTKSAFARTPLEGNFCEMFLSALLAWPPHCGWFVVGRDLSSTLVAIWKEDLGCWQPRIELTARVTTGTSSSMRSHSIGGERNLKKHKWQTLFKIQCCKNPPWIGMLLHGRRRRPLRAGWVPDRFLRPSTLATV